ncbi:MAG: hypothetical protein M3273_06345 [Actinomycetota bacterium]|nr:hypothetical protein [Actinomycetota bacterium]
MVRRNSSRAIAIFTSLSLAASIAVLALATAGTNDALAQGCRRGANPSPSASEAATPSASGLPIPSLPIPGSSTPSATPTGTPGGSPAPSSSPTQSSAPAPRDQEVPIAQEQRTTCKSTITIAYSARRKAFSGRVKSAEDLCKKARKVQVLKDAKRDKVVGRAVTNNKGGYKVPSANPNGRFYAKVAKKTVRGPDGRITCQADRSKTIRP